MQSVDGARYDSKEELVRQMMKVGKAEGVSFGKIDNDWDPLSNPSSGGSWIRSNGEGILKLRELSLSGEEIRN